ncbi:hypothetical protein EJA05_08890 [Pseudomonas oryziphila]|uniref:Uncharacterized protein n=1 Tax=Pseudomonas entomophila TaxID=312306 RepID=A0A3S8UHM7_9PSED|nr:hypothetical protein EJA05_08890 [Pseudomonas oryziphila]
MAPLCRICLRLTHHRLRPYSYNAWRQSGAHPVGAAVRRCDLPANTGRAGAIHRATCFAVVRHSGKPAPTGIAPLLHTGKKKPASVRAGKDLRRFF